MPEMTAQVIDSWCYIITAFQAAFWQGFLYAAHAWGQGYEHPV